MALDTLPHVLIVGFTYQISVEHESFAKVVEDLINQYTLGFEPQRDGRDHQIRVQVPGRGVRVRARRIYTAPPELPSAK